MVFGDIADGISAECRFQRKVAGNDRVKVAGAMLFYRIIHSEYLTTDFADELMGDRRKEVAVSCAVQNTVQDDGLRRGSDSLAIAVQCGADAGSDFRSVGEGFAEEAGDL